MLTKTQTREYTIPISELLSFRLYSDTRPHHHYIAGLQKGLIFVYRGAELVGEGIGFGVPIVRFRDKTYFSGSSKIQIFQKDNCTIAVKKFALDTISDKRFRRVKMDTPAIRKLSMRLDELYQKHRHWRLLTIANLSKRVGVQKRFVRTKPKGSVTVTYLIDPPLIHVKADFDLFQKETPQRIFVLNEQGSRFFRKYSDSHGKALSDKQIGAWEKAEAHWACISSKNGEVGFRLWKVKGAIMYRGREFLQDTFDWAGLDYEFDPQKTSLEYDIEILGSLKHT